MEVTYGELAIIVTALSGLVSGILSYIQSKRTSRKTDNLEHARLDFDKEKNIWKQYESFVDNLQTEVETLRHALESEREEIKRLSARLEMMAEERLHYIKKIDILQSTVDDLRLQLQRAYGKS